jgi:aryl-alcohol dehydrogenase-like predicted oxidoreductase
MDYVTLGRTQLPVSVLGLGGGGHSRLGQAAGCGEDESVAIVRRALEMGVNFIDTAEAYRTEEIVGRAVRGLPRERIVISTKKSIDRGGRVVTPAELTRGLEASLGRLGMDYVDVYHLHGVLPEQYDEAREALVPEMLKLREAGKIRFLGITERFVPDPGHGTLSRAVLDDCWDVLMVGFNILNQSARRRVLAGAMEKDLGILVMFAVRNALSRPERLVEVVGELIAEGRLDGEAIDPADPLGFLLRDGVATSLPDAAYRFCRAESGVHVVLSGTGSVEHLEQNVASVLSPPLPFAVRERLERMFDGVDHVSAQ